MPRSMSAAMLAAIQDSILYPAIFVHMEFASGPAYIWSGYGSVSWNSHTWLGVGNLGSISVVEDGASINSRGISLSLSGINSSMLADVLQELQLGLPVAIYLGLFDGASPPSLLPDPLTVWAGRIDQPTIDVGGDTAVITQNCENRLIDMNVAVDRRYTQDDQQIDNPGDLGFQFVNSIQEIHIYFGRSPNHSNA